MVELKSFYWLEDLVGLVCASLSYAVAWKLKVVKIFIEYKLLRLAVSIHCFKSFSSLPLPFPLPFSRFRVCLKVVVSVKNTHK